MAINLFQHRSDISRSERAPFRGAACWRASSSRKQGREFEHRSGCSEHSCWDSHLTRAALCTRRAKGISTSSRWWGSRRLRWGDPCRVSWWRMRCSRWRSTCNGWWKWVLSRAQLRSEETSCNVSLILMSIYSGSFSWKGEDYVHHGTCSTTNIDC